MICVYPADCTDFSSNGLGAVTPMSCTVTETLNGEWELTLVHDIDERGKWTRLSEGCVLRSPVPAAMTPSVDLVTQQYQTSTYDVQIYKITTKSGPLHLRSGTGTNYKILGKYKKGREVIVLNKTTSSWYEVTAPDGKHGYMASQYLTFQRTETQTVQTNVGFRNQVIEARQLRDQPFRIYRVVPELDKVTVYARHVFYDLLDNMIKSLKPSPSAVGASVVQSLSGACLSSHDFSFYSDLTSTAEDVEWENINPVEAMLGENGLVSKYGAELARDWYDVFLVRRVGNDTDVSIREKKNLTGISYDVDETDVVTRIMPTGEDADGNILYLPELYIDSPNLNAYTHPKWIHLPVSEAKEVTDGDEPKSQTQCYAEMRKAAQDEYAKGCDLPTITLKVDFVNCSDAEEYRQYAALTDIFLGDSVRVVARRIGVEVSMRMTQYTYDCLTKKYTQMTLGTVADTVEGNVISARQLPSGIITGSKLAINSVGTGQLQSGSVGSVQIQMAAIETAHIQDAAISKAKIGEAAVGTAQIEDAAIIRAKIAQGAIGSAQIDDASITRAKIGEAAIGAAQIEDGVITSAKIGAGEIQEATITCNSFINGKMTGSRTCTVTLTVPSTVVPVISSVTLQDTNETVAAQIGAFVKSLSTLSVAITAEGIYGSSISSYRTTLDGATYTAASFTAGKKLSAAGDMTLTVSVTDSRGRTATYGLAVIDPLTEFLRILRAVGGKRGAKPLKHLRPALGSSFAQEGGVEGLTRAHVDGGEFLQQFLIRIGGRVGLHQSVSRIEKLCWRHGKHFVHGNKVIFLCVCPSRCGIGSTLRISRKRKQLHLLLNGIDIGQILVPGQHRAGDRPHRCGGHVHARHTVGQLALPSGKRDGISARLVQHGGGVRPRIQKLHIAEAIRFRQDVDHRLCADVKPCLRIDGIDVRRHDGAERGVRQLLCMVELIDGRTASHGSVRIGR